MPDKRGYTRFIIAGNVELTPESGSTITLKGDLIDISFVGFSVYLKERIEVNTLLQFSLVSMICPGYFFSGKARIKYILENKKYARTAFKSGFEFVGMDKEILVSFLNRIQEKIRQEERRKRQSDGLVC